MMSLRFCRTLLLHVVAWALLGTFAVHAQPKTPRPDKTEKKEISTPAVSGPKYPDVTKGTENAKRGASDEKLDVTLRLLYRQFSRTRGKLASDTYYSPRDLNEMFAIDSTARNPAVRVIVVASAPIDSAILVRAGALEQSHSGMNYEVLVAVTNLGKIAAINQVESVRPSKPARIPDPPPSEETPQFEPPGGGRTRGDKSDNEFDAGGYTGRNVLIGICDTGIDWKHEDFRRPDGTSRILYLWDMTDDSWDESEGAVGTKPPPTKGHRTLGTLYTNEQINAALKGEGTVNAEDSHGHGTACAGIAAGNGRATGNGVPAGTWMGVAPEADLIIVKAGNGSFSSAYVDGVRWMAGLADSLKRPCVVNLSLGGQFTAHDGTEDEEKELDALAGMGKRGFAICVAAGNERRYLFHGSARFGPREDDQADIKSSPVDLTVHDQGYGKTMLMALLDNKDDWGLTISSADGPTYGAGDTSTYLHIYKTQGRVRHQVLSAGRLSPAVSEALGGSYEFDTAMNGHDRVTVLLEEGKYRIWGFGATANVTKGEIDLYVPAYYRGTFSRGYDLRAMVGSPGNAANVITVGSYDFRGSWENARSKRTRYNLKIGDISAYSNPGYRRDGVVKPDIAAPGQYAVSSVSRRLNGKYCTMGTSGGSRGSTPDSTKITRDGYHLAWNGTSAATPFVAGVIALMFEKNPELDAEQIRSILHTTARHDSFTGSVPNRDWGYGKINPAAAIAATPIP